MRRSRTTGVAVISVLAMLMAGAANATATPPAAPSSTTSTASALRTVDGTANLGQCDSVQAVTANGVSFACWGSNTTDFKALRQAYKTGGMTAVQTVSATQQAATKTSATIRASSGGINITGYHNVKNSDTSWTYYGTIIYGVIDYYGNLTEYGRVFVRDDLLLYGNNINFKYNFARVVGYGSDVAVSLENYFSAGYGWTGSYYTCPRTNWLAGHTATCNHTTSLAGYAGNGFYAHSLTKWWNAYESNPSSADGSWTVVEPHGVMNCVLGRTQPCIFQ